MGSEQSQHPGSSQGQRSASTPPRLVRGHTIAVPESSRGQNLQHIENPGNISPGPSVCSDSDLPYISYTVNRPIGDSPKLTNKSAQLTRGRSTATASKKSLIISNTVKTKANSKAHTIVVVKAGIKDPTAEKDPEIMRLQQIPMFLPVMRGTLSLPSNRDPEVLERLQPQSLQALCSKLQAHFTTCANMTATEQGIITQRIRETDADISKLMTAMTDKQKRYAKYVEKLSKVHELSHQLNRCHMLLNQTIESMDTLNNLLEVEDRLEPFVWTTG